MNPVGAGPGPLARSPGRTPHDGVQPSRWRPPYLPYLIPLWLPPCPGSPAGPTGRRWVQGVTSPGCRRPSRWASSAPLEFVLWRTNRLAWRHTVSSPAARNKGVSRTWHGRAHTVGRSSRPSWPRTHADITRGVSVIYRVSGGRWRAIRTSCWKADTEPSCGTWLPSLKCW